MDGLQERSSKWIRFANLTVVVVPFIGLIAACVLLWGRGFSAVHLGLLIGMFVLTGLGITVGFHRLFTHSSFETVPAVKVILGILGSMAFEGPILRWVATHRRHHQHSDQADDPHSPHQAGRGLRGLMRGFWHAHIGWTLHADPPNMSRYVGDLRRDRAVRIVSDLFPVWAFAGLAIPAALGGLLTRSWHGALLGFLWGGAARVFLVQHVTFSINSVCHLWGTRPFQSRDRSRNNFVFGLFGFGEGWHNNHHAFPNSARHGLRWWEPDLGYLVIRALAVVGLAWNVRSPAAELQEAKRNRDVEPTVVGLAPLGPASD